MTNRLTRRQFLQLTAKSAGAWFLTGCMPLLADAQPNGVPTLFPTGQPATPQPTSTPTPLPTNIPTSAAQPPAALTLPNDFVAGRITSNESFYITTYSDRVNLDSSQWRLTISGLVDTPITLNYTQVLSLPAFDLMQTLQCISNPVGGGLIGNALWRGTPLLPLLEMAGLRAGAAFAELYGADEYMTSVPLSRLMDERTHLVYRMNGEPLPIDHGYPLRVLMPDVYGQKQPKWLVGINITDVYRQGYWETLGWSDEAIINPTTRIEMPSRGDTILAGRPVPLAGIAFSDASGVVAVEVSLDAGQTWQPAEMLPGPNNSVWTLWVFRWDNPQPGEYRLVARAIDGSGRRNGIRGAEDRLLTGLFPDGTNMADNIDITVVAV